MCTYGVVSAGEKIGLAGDCQINILHREKNSNTCNKFLAATDMSLPTLGHEAYTFTICNSCA